MSNESTLIDSVKAEWIKFRSVRSSITGMLVTLLLTIGLGALIGTAIRNNWHHMDPLRRATFDPVASALVGTAFASFAIGVIGTLFITSEYSTGSIRTSLAAVPNRPRLLLSKLVVLKTSVFIIAEIACFTTFAVVMAVFKGVVPTASLSNACVLRAVFLGGVYLTLLAVLGFALGLILKQSSICISVFVSLLLILPIIILFLPSSWQDHISKFEPSELGRSMMSASTQANHFTAWTATGILALYVLALLATGFALFTRRDA